MLIKEHSMSYRWKKISKYLQENEKNVDGLFICDGEDDADSVKIKVLAVQSYLFRFEFVNSVMVLLPNVLVFFSSPQKCVLMREFGLDPTQEIREVVFSGKEPSPSDFELFFQVLSKLGRCRLGHFEKEKPRGVFGGNFMERVAEKVELVDVSREVQEFLSIKEPEDLHLLRGSARFTTLFFRRFVEQIEEVVDSGREASHPVLAERLDQFMETARGQPNQWNLNGRFFDFAYTPVIQSNSDYSLKLTGTNSAENVSSDCVLLNLCGKFHEMHCLLVRTLLVNPLSSDRRHYRALEFLQSQVISHLLAGEALSKVFGDSRAAFLERFPDLEAALPQSFGFGMGFEYKERCLSISSKNPRRVQDRQVFAVVTSLRGLQGFASGKVYAMQLADTVVITLGRAEVLTDKISKKIDEVGYDFKEEPRMPEHDNYMRRKLRLLEEKASQLSGRRVTRAALREEKMREEGLRRTERRKHQRKLLEEKMRDLEKRFEQGEFEQRANLAERARVADMEVYSQSSFPGDLGTDQVRTDAQKWAVLLPVGDRLVPFHVGLLKRVARQSDGETTRIRFQFHHPGVPHPGLAFPDSESLPEGSLYLQELVFSSPDVESATSLVKRIRALRKKWVQREDSVENLQSNPDLGAKLAVLHDLKIRPALGGKKLRGTLSAFAKGFQFVSKKDDRLCLEHSNIRHAIFQPCGEDLILVIHFRLHQPVLVNRKKTLDVQFYCEVGVLAEDLGDARRRGPRFHTQNPGEEEQAERYLRRKFNDTFSSFVDLVRSKAPDATPFETPQLGSSFFGSPFYNSVRLSPCESCLVSVVETPPFVLSLADVELVSIERVDSRIKSFDLVFIFKDYSRTVQSVSNVPKGDLERVRHWLDSKGLLFFEGGGINLKWDNILKKIRGNAREFIIEEGGWRAFFDEEDASGEDQAGDDFEDESSFNEADCEDDVEGAYKEDDILEDMDDDEDDDDYQEEDAFEESLSSSPEKKARPRGRK